MSPRQTGDLFANAIADFGGSEAGDQILAALEDERSRGGIIDIIEAEIFAKLLSDDLNRSSSGLALEEIAQASIHARVVHKFTAKEITETQMYAELEATRGGYTDADISEAEVFAKSLGDLRRTRGELSGKDFMEAKVFAKFLSRALAKVREQLDAKDRRDERSDFTIGPIDTNRLPPSHGTIWLDANEIWLTTPSVNFTFDGRTYEIPGGAMCFPKERVGREVLLRVLGSQRDLWEPSDQEALKMRLIRQAQRLQS